MYERLKILLFSPYLPAIDTSGFARKLYDYIRFGSQRGYKIYLVSFWSEEDKKRIGAIRCHCTRVHLYYLKDYSCYPFNASIKAKVRSICENEGIDILQCEKAYMASYLAHDINIPLILVEHEILSASFSARIALENNFINKIIFYARKIKKTIEEKKWYKKFDKIIVFSEEDRRIIKNFYKIENIDVIPLGINLQDYALKNAKEKLYDIMFMGNFSHFPNVDAVLHFYKRILPLIRNRLPNISVIIAGAEPPPIIKKLQEIDKNITVTGYIHNVIDIYSKSKVFIAPIRYGTGMHFKVLEALAMRIPTVTTSIGARGIIFKECVRIADTEKELAEAVIELLIEPDKYNSLVKIGELILEKYYNWDIILDRHENIYNKLLNLNSERISK